MKYSSAVVVTLAAKILALVLGLASSIIVARYLGPSGRGALSVLMALVGAAFQFGSVGLNGAVLFYASKEQHHRREIAWIVFVVSSVMGLVIAMIYAIVAQWIPSLLLGDVDVVFLTIVLIAIPFTFYTQLYQSLFVAAQEVVAFNILDLASKTIAVLGFVLALVVLSGGLLESIWSFAVTSVLAGVLSLVWAVVKFGIARPFDADLARGMVRYGLRAYVASLLLFFTLRVNLFAINASLGQDAAGLYAVAMQFSDIISLLPMALGMILFPRVAGDQADRGVLTAKVFRFSVLVIGAACCVLAIGGGLIVDMLFGEEFAGSVIAVWCLVPGIFTLSLWMILNNDLGARGMPWVVVAAPGIALTINATGNALFLTEWGIAGSAVSATVANTVGLGIVFVYFVRRFSVPVPSMLFFTVDDARSTIGRWWKSDSSSVS